MDAGIPELPFGGRRAGDARRWAFSRCCCRPCWASCCRGRTRASSPRWRSSVSPSCSTCVRTTSPKSIPGIWCGRRCCKASRWRCSSMPLTAIILSGQPPQRIPAAAGLSNFVRVFCGAVGDLHRGHGMEQPDHPAPRTPDRGRHHLPTRCSASRSNRYAALLYLNTGAANTLFDTSAERAGGNDGAGTTSSICQAAIFLLIIPVIWITRPAKGGGGACSSY